MNVEIYDLDKYEAERKRALKNRWKKGFKSQIFQLKEIDKNNFEKLDLVIENIVKELKGEDESKIIFFDNENLSSNQLKNIEKLNKILLKKSLRKEEIENLRKRKKKLKNDKQHSRTVLRTGFFEGKFDDVVIQDLHQLLEFFEDILVEKISFEKILLGAINKKNKKNKKDKVNSCEKLIELIEKRDLFFDMVLQIIIYHFSHEKIPNEDRVSILTEILDEVKDEVDRIREISLINDTSKQVKDKYNPKEIYLIFFKHYCRYEIEYKEKLIEKIQSVVVDDSFEFTPISESEIKEYFDSLTVDDNDGDFVSEWSNSKMNNILSEKEGIRDNKIQQKYSMIKAIIEYLNLITGRRLDIDNFKNLKVVYQEIFINNTKLPSSRNTPRQQILKFHREIENFKKEKNILELSQNEFYLRYKEEFNNFFSEEEKIYISEKITRGMYLSEGMETEYKLTKKIEKELLEYTKELFKFNDENFELKKLLEFIKRVFYFLNVLVEKYNLNNYQVISINQKLRQY